MKRGSRKLPRRWVFCHHLLVGLCDKFRETDSGWWVIRQGCTGRTLAWVTLGRLEDSIILMLLRRLLGRRKKSWRSLSVGSDFWVHGETVVVTDLWNRYHCGRCPGFWKGTSHSTSYRNSYPRQHLSWRSQRDSRYVGESLEASWTYSHWTQGAQISCSSFL